MESFENKAELSSDLFSLTFKNLILMCGWPGTGKTTIANRVAKGIERSYILNRDRLRSEIAKSGFIDSVLKKKIAETDVKLYAQAEKLLKPIDMLHIDEFTILLQDLTFLERLQRVETLILDGTFHSFEKRKRAYWFAEQHGCEPVVIFCTCSAEKALQRLQHQIEEEEKIFKYPPEEVLKYYHEHFNSLERDTTCATVIQIDTENHQKPAVTIKSIYRPSLFIQRLLKILEKPDSL